MGTKLAQKKSHTFRSVISNSMSLTGGLGLGFCFVGILAVYIFKQESGRYLVYAGTTFIGLFLLSVYLGFVFHTIKKMDKDYFKSIMTGVSGGLAVWAISGIRWDDSHGFWLAMNDIITKILIFLAVIFIGFLIYRRMSKES